MNVWYSGMDWYEEKAPILNAVDGVAENGNTYVKLTIERYRADGSAYEWVTCVFAQGAFDAADVLAALNDAPLYFCGGTRKGRNLAPVIFTD